MTIKRRSHHVIIVFILILFLFSLIGIVNGENEFLYQKYNNPVFTLGSDPLIYSFNASYSLENKKYERPFYSFSYAKPFNSFSDNNLFLSYTITGKKYLGRNVNLGGSCIPLIFKEEGENAPYPICIQSTVIAQNGTTIIPQVLIYYTTTIPEIDEYANNPSYEAEILVHYIISNPKISEVSPIILNLGKWPVRVNDEKITDMLNKPILNDTILIFGSNNSMILNKGDNNIVSGAMTVGSVNYTGSTKLISFPRRNPNFSYIFYEDHGDYFLKVQRTTQSQEGILSLNFRPVKIAYAIKIKYPIVDRTYNFLDAAPDRLNFKPDLQINISNNEIQQLNFKFIKYGNTEFQNITSDQNGIFHFNELMDAYGNSFLYPFDYYTAKIVVNPPLLISDNKEILTPANSGFTADIEIFYKNINFKFSRPLDSILVFFSGLIIVLLSLIGLLLRPEADRRLIVIPIIGLIVSIIPILVSNGLNHLVSLGTIIIFISLISIIIVYYYIQGSQRQPNTQMNQKAEKAIKKKIRRKQNKK
jgi:hypothetical protein